jgi:hypothetical protein
MIYFDNHPHGHFGTIRQQIWSCLHFPIHLAIVGLVEGAQQIALARYVASGIMKVEKSLVQYCLKDHLDGEDLVAKLTATVKYLQLDKKVTSLIFLDEITRDVTSIGETAGICGLDEVTGSGFYDLPEKFQSLYFHVAGAMYSALGQNMPLDEDVLVIMVESWKLVYRYFWASFLILIGCFMVIMILIRTTKVDAFDYFSFFDRGFVLVAAAVILAVSASHDIMYSIMETPAILPIAVGLLYLIILLDRLGAWIANRRNVKSGDPLTGAHAGHAHGHGHDDHSGGEHGHDAEPDKQGLIVSSTPAAAPHNHQRQASGPEHFTFSRAGTWAMPSYSPTTPSPGYSSQGFGSPHVTLYDTPQPTPPPQTVGQAPAMTATYVPGGYMPVHSGQFGHYAGDGY